MSQSTVFLDTELRKLRPAELCTLGQILNISDSWKKLMAIIPKTENCDFPKFHSEHFSMIEQAAQQQRRNAAEIFLSEWGTMGKKRPTLRILLNLLVKAELFRAADYVAGNILKEELPKRPEYGPAAPIDISDEEIKKLLEENVEPQNTCSRESLIFNLPSDNNDNNMANPNAIDNAANNNSLQRNMQSTKLISTKEEHNDKCLDSVGNQQQKGVNTLNVNDSNSQRRDFRDKELPSCELPLPLMEFGLNIKETTLNGIKEVQSDELPIVLNDSIIASSDSLQVNPTNSSSNLPNLNFNRNELVTAELPQCIVEFGCTINPHNINFNEENIVQNVLNSQELPITVLAYNESYS
ncbi:interleukin 1 receptor associated kinase 4 tube isoform X2 [Halictus rubicundus]|uniref:interleukin 1 receptor associated kinase 4 tube isoform X2 n=1 Tax=Halictus rubicundus TaxID=77578 RepID=UPI0040354753